MIIVDFCIDNFIFALFIFMKDGKAVRPKKKIMSVSSDMSKNIRVGRLGKSFFFQFLFFLKKS